VPTAGISLVRDNTERLQPPRFLWTPFELGRPFGAPNEAEFQTRVLRRLLALFDHPGPPPVLLDFPDDAPGPSADMTGWTCPIPLPPIPLPPVPITPDTEAAPDTIGTAIQAEIDQLSPWSLLAAETRGRKATGVLGAPIEEIAQFLWAFRETSDPKFKPAPLKPGTPLGENVRQACEELKSYYMAAAAAKPGAASSRDLADWFWGDTAAGALLLSLHPVLLAHTDSGVRNVALSQLAPRLQQHRLPSTKGDET
jgi:hypothetical protein